MFLKIKHNPLLIIFLLNFINYCIVFEWFYLNKDIITNILHSLIKQKYENKSKLSLLKKVKLKLLSLAKLHLYMSTLNFIKMWIFHQKFFKNISSLVYIKKLCLHVINLFNACLFTIFKTIKVFYKTLTTTVNNIFTYTVNIFNTDNLFWKIY